MDQVLDAKLIECDSNPVPEGAVTGYLETTDGMRLRYARWGPTVRPARGTVIILHGRTEFIEKYFETVKNLRERGFGVLTFDWRGQGGSTRALKDPLKGHVENFDQYLLDLETVMQEVALPDCRAPLYILAHSTGALVALLAAPQYANRIERMVLLSPLLALNRLPVSQVSLTRILGLATFVGLGSNYVAKRRTSGEERAFISNPLTSDPIRFQRMKDILAAGPELRVGAPTIAWVFAACRAMALVNQPGFANSISIPTLLIAAGNDRVVKPSVIEAYGRKMRTGSFLTISGARHELCEESDIYREQMLAAFDAFVPGSGT